MAELKVEELHDAERAEKEEEMKKIKEGKKKEKDEAVWDEGEDWERLTHRDDEDVGDEDESSAKGKNKGQFQVNLC